MVKVLLPNNTVVNLTGLKTKIKPGLMFTREIIEKLDKGDDGAVGRYLEDMLISEGYNLNRGRGPDLFGVIDVKSRRFKSKSPMSVGTMSVNDIIKTPWAASNIRKKAQAWFMIMWNRDGTVASADLLDLSNPMIQNSFEQAYEACRKVIISEPKLEIQRDKDGKMIGLAPAPRTEKIEPNDNGFMELVSAKKNGSYKFRLKPDRMQKIIDLANNAETDMFSWEDIG